MNQLFLEALSITRPDNSTQVRFCGKFCRWRTELWEIMLELQCFSCSAHKGFLNINLWRLFVDYAFSSAYVRRSHIIFRDGVRGEGVWLWKLCFPGASCFTCKPCLWHSFQMRTVWFTGFTPNGVETSLRKPRVWGRNGAEGWRLYVCLQEVVSSLEKPANCMELMVGP